MLQSVADASSWSASDWDTKSANGIQASGTKVTLRRNKLKNVNFGISVSATSSLVDDNTVDGFAGDGLRGLGDNTVFQYNLVKNCYDVNANHDDGFQSWSVGSNGQVGTGQVTGVVLRGNRIINYEDPSQPFRHSFMLWSSAEEETYNINIGGQVLILPFWTNQVEVCTWYRLRLCNTSMENGQDLSSNKREAEERFPKDRNLHSMARFVARFNEMSVDRCRIGP